MRCASSVPILFTISAFAQSWQQLPDFPGTARDDAASFGYECYAYVGTGMEVGWSLTNDWWRFDVSNGSWGSIAALPASPRQYCASHTTTEGGYLFGGLDANGPQNELWFYSFTTGQWEPRAPLPAPGRYACSAFGNYNELYIVAGLFADGSATNELWEYDVLDDEWAQRSSVPGIGRHRSASCNAGQYNYLFGGADAFYNPLDESWRYDSDNDLWLELAPLPDARYSASALAFGQGIVNFCGVDGSGAVRSDGFQYIGQLDSWVPWQHDFVGPRRSGILLHALPCSGFPCYYFGIGYDGNARHNDWFSLCPATGIDELTGAFLAIIPNPASDNVQLGIDPSSTGSHVTIFDASGQLVTERSLPANGSLNIEALGAGSYVIRVQSVDRIRTARFIKLP